MEMRREKTVLMGKIAHCIQNDPLDEFWQILNVDEVVETSWIKVNSFILYSLLFLNEYFMNKKRVS